MKFAKAAQAFDPNALQGLTNPSTFGSAMQKSGLGSASLTLGFTSSNTTQTGTSATPVVTSLSSGGSLGVVAKDGSITGNGVQIAAGLKPDGTPTDPTDPTVGNVLLSAGKDITLTAARGTSC